MTGHESPSRVSARLLFVITFFQLEETLHHIFQRKNITVVMPEGINSLEYLFFKEKILWSCL
jgi:hypothetical protein